MAANFNQAIAISRRRAQLAGMPLSQRETAGIAEGASDVASERAARLKAVKNQEDQIAEQRRANLQQEKFRQQQFLESRRQAKQAERSQRAQSTVSAAGIGATIGSYAATGTSVGGPWGAVIGAALGAAVGLAQNWSHYCAVIGKTVPDAISSNDMRHLIKFRRWCDMNRGEHTFLYDLYAPYAIDSMKEQLGEDGFRDRLAKLHKEGIMPVLARIRDGEMSAAFDVYKETVGAVIAEYEPESVISLSQLESREEVH